MVDSKSNDIVIEIDKNEKKNTLRLLVVIGIPFLLYFIIRDLIVGRYLPALLLSPLILLVSFLVPLLIQKIDREENYSLVYQITFFLFFLLLGIVLVYLLGVEGNYSRVPWFYIFPLLAFLTMGYRIGFVMTVVLLVFILFFNYRFSNFVPIEFEEIRFRFFISILTITIISFMMERWRSLYKMRLIENHYRILESEKRINDNNKRLQISEEKYRNLVNTMQEGLVGVDADWHINFVNDRFVEIIGYPKEQLIGTSFYRLISKKTLSVAEKQHKLRIDGNNSIYELELITSEKTKLTVLCSPNPSYDADGNYLGGFGVISDITERKAIENEKEKLIQELQSALDEIKTLNGLIPICSSCKKIRDDEGYWNVLESYIQKHSNAQFSHGMCPECSDRLYGDEDWYIEIKKEEGDTK